MYYKGVKAVLIFFLMNIFVRWTIILLAVAGVILLIFPVPWFPSFYDVRYMGWAALGGVVLIFALPWLARVKEGAPDAGRKNKAADLMQMFLAFMIASNALGDLGLYKLYKIGFEYDKVLHFFTPFLGVIFVSLFLSGRFGISKAKSIAIAVAIFLACGVSWEVYEYLADMYLKTHISGVYGVDISTDTKFDLLFDLIGSSSGAVGAVFLWGRSFLRLGEVVDSVQ